MCFVRYKCSHQLCYTAKATEECGKVCHFYFVWFVRRALLSCWATIKPHYGCLIKNKLCVYILAGLTLLSLKSYCLPSTVHFFYVSACLYELVCVVWTCSVVVNLFCRTYLLSKQAQTKLLLEQRIVCVSQVIWDKTFCYLSHHTHNLIIRKRPFQKPHNILSPCKKQS